MASTASKGRKKTPAKTGRGGAKGGKQKTTRKPSAAELQAQSAITSEIILIGVLALTILLFLCNFGVIGVIGNQISRVMFGIFGTMAYALPVLAFIAIAFGISNQGNRIASMKLTAGIILFFLLGVVCSLLFQGDAVDGLFDPGAVSGKRQKAAGRRCHIRLPCLGAAPASWHGRHSTAFVGVGDYLHSYYHRAFVCERCKDFWQICL